MNFEVEQHNRIDKSFQFFNDWISMKVDYDDVNHYEVDTAIQYIRELLNDNWSETEFKERHNSRIHQIWNENEDNVLEDFQDKEEFLENYLL